MSDLELLTKAEVMGFLRISKRTLDLLMRSGAVRYFKLQRKVLFKRSDVEAFLESRAVKPAKPNPKRRTG